VRRLLAWTLAFLLVVAVVAVVLGGFLWPRPQFRRGPWHGGGAPPADTSGLLPDGGGPP